MIVDWLPWLVIMLVWALFIGGFVYLLIVLARLSRVLERLSQALDRLSRGG